MPPVQRILILAANPLESSKSRLDEELCTIESVLTRAKQRDRFDIRLEMDATSASDIELALLDYNPQIVHFCGQGAGDDRTQEIIFADDQGEGQVATAQDLADLFELFADQVKCVVLGGCYAEAQAAAIVEHIDAVVGVTQPIGEAAGSRFAEGFYKGLGAGKDVAFAYKLGRNALEAQGVPEAQIPVLKKRPFDSAQGPGEMQLHPKPQPKPERSRRLAGSAFDYAQAPNVAEQEQTSDELPIEEEKQAPTREVSSDPDTPAKRSRIFISYKRDVAPDEPVAREICLALQAQHDVFIDRKMPAGTPWAERIEAELKASDVLIVLLSAHSVKSEMVEHEVELAYRFAKEKSEASDSEYQMSTTYALRRQL